MSWLRVVTYQLPDEGVDNAVDFIKAGTETVVRILEEQPGFGGAYWGESPEDNTVSAVTHWSSLEAIQAAEGALEKVQELRDGSPGITVLEVHNVGLFAVPAVSMWSDDDDAAPSHKESAQHLFPNLLARWRRH